MSSELTTHPWIASNFPSEAPGEEPFADSLTSINIPSPVDH